MVFLWREMVLPLVLLCKQNYDDIEHNLPPASSISRLCFERNVLMATPLRGYQNRYLRGLAHALKPVVLIGQKGVNARTVASITEALNTHELIKVKFVDIEDRDQKKTMISTIKEACDCIVAGVTGHVAILYRPRNDPGKRTIILPKGTPEETG